MHCSLLHAGPCCSNEHESAIVGVLPSGTQWPAGGQSSEHAITHPLIAWGIHPCNQSLGYGMYAMEYYMAQLYMQRLVTTQQDAHQALKVGSQSS